jgi:hypothetical protein
MSSSDLLNNKQALELIKGISLSPSLQKSKDSILLAEDQYPDHLDSIFGKADKANDLSRTISLLKWNRKTERGSLEKKVYNKLVAAQDSLRSTMQDAAHPHDGQSLGKTRLPGLEAQGCDHLSYRSPGSDAVRREGEFKSLHAIHSSGQGGGSKR